MHENNVLKMNKNHDKNDSIAIIPRMEPIYVLRYCVKGKTNERIKQNIRRKWIMHIMYAAYGLYSAMVQKNLSLCNHTDTSNVQQNDTHLKWENALKYNE